MYGRFCRFRGLPSRKKTLGNSQERSCRNATMQTFWNEYSWPVSYTLNTEVMFLSDPLYFQHIYISPMTVLSNWNTAFICWWCLKATFSVRHVVLTASEREWCHRVINESHAGWINNVFLLISKIDQRHFPWKTDRCSLGGFSRNPFFSIQFLIPGFLVWCSVFARCKTKERSPTGFTSQLAFSKTSCFAARSKFFPQGVGLQNHDSCHDDSYPSAKQFYNPESLKASKNGKIIRVNCFVLCCGKLWLIFLCLMRNSSNRQFIWCPTFSLLQNRPMVTTEALQHKSAQMNWLWRKTPACVPEETNVFTLRQKDQKFHHWTEMANRSGMDV